MTLPHVLRSPERFAAYHTAVLLEREHELLELDAEPSYFYGPVAEHLGVDGLTPSYEQLVRAAQGRCPLSDRSLVQQQFKSSSRRRCGTQVVFAPHKSVSLLWALAPSPESRAQIEQCCRDAAHDVVLEVCSVSQTRRGKGGKHRVDAKPLVHIDQHVLSRDGQPHLHAHATFFGIACSADGRFSALDNSVLFKRRVELSRLYENRLYVKLKNMGYQVELECHGRHPQTRAQEVPVRLCEAFSSRTKQVREHMRQRGLRGWLASAYSNLSTRNGKQTLSPERQREIWLKQATRAGVSREQIARMYPEPARSNDTRATESGVQLELSEQIRRLGRTKMFGVCSNKLAANALAREQSIQADSSLSALERLERPSWKRAVHTTKMLWKVARDRQTYREDRLRFKRSTVLLIHEPQGLDPEHLQRLERLANKARCRVLHTFENGKSQLYQMGVGPRVALRAPSRTIRPTRRVRVLAPAPVRVAHDAWEAKVFNIAEQKERLGFFRFLVPSVRLHKQHSVYVGDRVLLKRGQRAWGVSAGEFARIEKLEPGGWLFQGRNRKVTLVLEERKRLGVVRFPVKRRVVIRERELSSYVQLGYWVSTHQARQLRHHAYKANKRGSGALARAQGKQRRNRARAAQAKQLERARELTRRSARCRNMPSPTRSR